MLQAMKRRQNWSRIIYVTSVKNMNRLLIGRLNINSISNTFEQSKLLVRDAVDILVITEIKLQLTIPYRFDRYRNGGDILIYVREDIPSKPLTDHKIPHDIEGIFVQLNLRKNKWLLFGSYHPPSQSDEYFFNHVQNGLDIYSKFYDKHMLIGDFNADESEQHLPLFLFKMNAKNIVKEPTCFKSLKLPKLY